MSRWQKLRQAEVDLEKELLDAELEKLTTREREIRKRIEDLCAAQPNSDALQKPQVDSSCSARTRLLQASNGSNTIASTPSADDVDDDTVNANGVNGADSGKKGKKRKMEAR